MSSTSVTAGDMAPRKRVLATAAPRPHNDAATTVRGNTSGEAVHFQSVGRDPRCAWADGRLLSTVAVALLALPSTVQVYADPRDQARRASAFGFLVDRIADHRVDRDRRTACDCAPRPGFADERRRGNQPRGEAALPYFLAMLLWVGPIAILFSTRRSRCVRPRPAAEWRCSSWSCWSC